MEAWITLTSWWSTSAAPKSKPSSPRGALQAAGIDVMIQADTAGRQRDHIAWSGAGFKLLVREEDVEDARDVLDSPPPV